MTEHAASIFVFFFLAEYASILLMSILTTILFLGGYTYPLTPIIVLESVLNAILPIFWWIFVKVFYLFDLFTVWFLSKFDYYIWIERINFDDFSFNIKLVDDWLDIMDTPIFAGSFAGIILGIKTCFVVFTFIWVRASFPRIRYDQLMTFCWTVLLPILFAFIILIPCVLYSLDSIPVNLSLLTSPIIFSKYRNNKQKQQNKELVKPRTYKQKKQNKIVFKPTLYRQFMPLHSTLAFATSSFVTGVVLGVSLTLSILYLTVGLAMIPTVTDVIALEKALLLSSHNLSSAAQDFQVTCDHSTRFYIKSFAHLQKLAAGMEATIWWSQTFEAAEIEVNNQLNAAYLEAQTFQREYKHLLRKLIELNPGFSHTCDIDPNWDSKLVMYGKAKKAIAELAATKVTDLL